MLHSKFCCVYLFLFSVLRIFFLSILNNIGQLFLLLSFFLVLNYKLLRTATHFEPIHLILAWGLSVRLWCAKRKKDPSCKSNENQLRPHPTSSWLVAQFSTKWWPNPDFCYHSFNIFDNLVCATLTGKQNWNFLKEQAVSLFFKCFIQFSNGTVSISFFFNLKQKCKFVSFSGFRLLVVVLPGYYLALITTKPTIL